MSGRIPQEFIDDLIARVDIAEVLGTRLQLRKAGREYKALCPFHGEKTPSFTVSPDKGFYHCFGCGAHGTAVGFLMEHDHLSFVEAVEEIAGMVGIEVPREADSRPTRKLDALLALTSRVEQYYVDQLRDSDEAVAYLKQRGIDGATARAYRIGYVPAGWDHVLKRFGTDDESIERLHATGLVIRRDDGGYHDRFRHRVMFPIRDARGRTIGFGGRVLGDEEPKYLNSPETVLFHKGRELYGLYEAKKRLRDIRRLVVVEGYMDVVALARHGVGYAVATLGTATTADHLARVFRLTDTVCFCFDGDRAGRAAAWRALENALPQVREGREIRFAFLPEGEDPDSLVSTQGATAFEAVLDAGRPLSDFLVEELASRVDLESVDGRARLAELARPLVARIPVGIYRELLLERLGEAVGMAGSRLAGMMESPAEQPRESRRPARPRVQTGRPTLVRHAITLLLHHPASAATVDVERLAGLTRPGADLLVELLETLQAEPHMNTAGILERWRHRRHGEHLGALAASEMPGTDDFDAAAELAGCIRQLAQAARHDRVEFLRQKGRDGALSAEEREELRQLLSRPSPRSGNAGNIEENSV
jgi:DNA primase